MRAIVVKDIREREAVFLLSEPSVFLTKEYFQAIKAGSLNGMKIESYQLHLMVGKTNRKLTHEFQIWLELEKAGHLLHKRQLTLSQLFSLGLEILIHHLPYNRLNHRLMKHLQPSPTTLQNKTKGFF